MRIVTKYESKDGKLWNSEEECFYHERDLANCKRANDLLRSGNNLLECLRVAHGKYGSNLGFTQEQQEVLKSITKDSKLVIEHWQGCKDAVYAANEINCQGKVLFWGVGGWTGAASGWMDVRDIVHYWKKTQKDGSV